MFWTVIWIPFSLFVSNSLLLEDLLKLLNVLIWLRKRKVFFKWLFSYMIVIISGVSYNFLGSERFLLSLDLSLLYFNIWRLSISRVNTLIFASWRCLQIFKQLFFFFHRFNTVKIGYPGEIIFLSKYVVFICYPFVFGGNF